MSCSSKCNQPRMRMQQPNAVAAAVDAAAADSSSKGDSISPRDNCSSSSSSSSSSSGAACSSIVQGPSVRVAKRRYFRWCLLLLLLSLLLLLLLLVLGGPELRQECRTTAKAVCCKGLITLISSNGAFSVSLGWAPLPLQGLLLKAAAACAQLLHAAADNTEAALDRYIEAFAHAATGA